jgi:uroporphyrinogen-III decarboxylase
MARVWDFGEHFKRRAAREEYLDRPVEVVPGWCGPWTDGPVTVACNLFGASFVCEAMLEEPERLRKLLEFITEATIRRLTAWFKRMNQRLPMRMFHYADDSIALISRETYIEHVLPHHRRLCEAMGTPGAPRRIHLCGNATHLFKTLRDELNIQGFDTGFPVDFAALRKELGPDVLIQGGPHVELLLRGTTEDVARETHRIMTSGILEGRRFILREGNNLAPGTPLENTEAMYRIGRELGRCTPT